MTDAALDARPFPDSRALSAPGIYFDLPEEDYHADPALSQSGMKKLLVSPHDYWASSTFNPDYESGDSDGMRVGTAYHARIIEGREAFYQRYAVALDPADHPGALVTADDLRGRLKTLGLPVTAKRKDELIARLQEAGDDASIWDALVADHQEKNGGRQMLPFDLIKKIEIAAKMIEAHPDLCKAFTGGFPEVSIFWACAETGIPMKARLDYLKPAAIVDLKTFTNPMGKNLDKLIRHRIGSEGYFIQAAHYLEAVAAAKELVKTRAFSAVHGEGPGKDLTRWINAPEPTFLFIYQQQRVPTTRGLRFGRDFARLTISEGEGVVMQMKARWLHYWGLFGEEPWVDLTTVRDYQDGDAPDFYFNDHGDEDD